ncbi:MAG: hypothetical protein K2G83_06275 [Ruminococcus sp.]|nr:hypothetical protein [Ruminococcus sp.]
MKNNKKITLFRTALIYVVLTVGIWMFLYSYTNSYNRLTDEKISPASLIVNDDYAEIKILNKSCNISLDIVSPESRLYFAAYLFSPDELKSEILLLFKLLN